jgi:hypothetical protein
VFIVEMQTLLLRDQQIAEQRAKSEQEAIDKRAQVEREAAEKRAQTERDIAQDNQREVALQAYIGNMSELLLKHHLGKLTPEGTALANSFVFPPRCVLTPNRLTAKSSSS